MLSWTDADIESLLDADAVIAAIRDGFQRNYESVRMPQRLRLDVGSAIILLMPCAVAGEEICGMKIVSISRDRRPEGKVSATYIVIDTASGQTIAEMAANHLTDVRTAATSAIATDLLAHRNASTLGVFGTGRQAQAHIRMFSRRRRFQRILVCGSNREKTNAFAIQMRTQRGIEITPTDATTCASASDVICTCTTSAEPLFPGDLVRSGTHLNLIGAFQPHTREVDSVLIARSRIFVDTYEGCLAEAGDILVPLNGGEIQQDHIRGDLHELVSGMKPGRASDRDITIFKSVGCALEDLVTARLVMQSRQNRAANC
jgi:ornithine cyclodeaminase